MVSRKVDRHNVEFVSSGGNCRLVCSCLWSSQAKNRHEAVGLAHLHIAEKAAGAGRDL